MHRFLIAWLMFCPLMALAASGRYEIAIQGMTCNDCAQAVSMALAKIPNIDKSSVKVSLKANNATLTMNDTSKETQAQVQKAIEDAGYTVKSIHVIPLSKN